METTILSNMKQGEVNPNFYADSGVFCLDSYLIRLVNKMHHCDSYKREDNSWRVQGWCYLSDLPDKIPKELETSKAQGHVQIVEMNGRAAIEIWSLHFKDQELED